MIVVFGESLVDLIATAEGDPRLRYDAHAGGGPANTAVALARMGARVAMLTRLSRDRLGQLCRDRLATAGVDLRWAPRCDEPTPLAVANVDAHGSAAYDFYLAGTSEFSWSLGELPALPDEAVALHTGSLLWAVEPGSSIVDGELRREAGHRTLSLDPNVRPPAGSPEHYRSRLATAIGTVDLLKLSADDLAYTHPGADPVEIARGWCEQGVALVVVTLGGQGAVAVGRSFVIRRSAPRIDVVDTVGAGDAFHAGLLASLAQAELLGPGRLAGIDEGSAAVAVDMAIAASAITCQRAGADPPTAAEVAAFA